jgi:hypothetical protein
MGAAFQAALFLCPKSIHHQLTPNCQEVDRGLLRLHTNQVRSNHVPSTYQVRSNEMAGSSDYQMLATAVVLL